MPQKVQGQLEDVDQEISLQLIYETGRRPDSQITTFGLVTKHKVESREPVAEYFNIPEGLFNWMVLESQPTKSVHRRARLAIERNIDEMCPNRNPQSRMQRGNLDVRSVGTTRPLREAALFDGTCEVTDEDALATTVRAYRKVDLGINIVGIPRTVSKSHLEFCKALCAWQHERGVLYIAILFGLRGHIFRGTVCGSRNTAPE